MQKYITTTCWVCWVWLGHIWFQGWLLVLGNQFGGSSLADQVPLSEQSAAVCYSLGVGPHEISPFHASTSGGVVIARISLRQPYCWDIMNIAALSSLGDTISHQTFWSSGSYSPSISSSLVFCELQLLYWRSCITDVSNGTSLPIINWSLHSFWVTNFIWLADQRTSESLLAPPPQCWDYGHMPLQVLMTECQALNCLAISSASQTLMVL